MKNDSTCTKYYKLTTNWYGQNLGGMYSNVEINVEIMFSRTFKNTPIDSRTFKRT